VTADVPAPLAQALAGLACVVFDFDGVFTDNRVWVDQNGVESVACSRADGFGISALRDAGIETFVLSTEVNPVVTARCAKLDLPCVQGLAEKTAALALELQRRGIPAENAAYMGNDINDIACMQAVGIAVAPADAHHSVLPYVSHVTSAAGGYGAVRELCDLIIECRAHHGGGERS